MNKVHAAEWVRCLTRVRVDTFGAVGLATGLAEGLEQAYVAPEEAAALAKKLKTHEKRVRAAADLSEIYRVAASKMQARSNSKPQARFRDPWDVALLTFNAPDPAPW